MDYIIDTEQRKIYLDLLYIVNDYITFKVFVKIGKYVGEDMITFNYKDLQNQITNLDLLREGKVADFRLNDFDSSMYMAINKMNDDYFLLYGQLGGDNSDLILQYKAKIEQSSIVLLKEILCDSIIGF